MRNGLLAILALLGGLLSTRAEEAAIILSSPAFADGAPIPSKYSRLGGNASPPLVIVGLPTKTVSYALLMDSPDTDSGGVAVQWLAANYLPTQTTLEAGAVPKEVVLGANEWEHTRYDGPMPSKERRRYVFRIYALDVVLNLQRGFTREDLILAMSGHLLGAGQMTGTFGGPK